MSPRLLSAARRLSSDPGLVNALENSIDILRAAAAVNFEAPAKLRKEIDAVEELRRQLDNFVAPGNVLMLPAFPSTMEAAGDLRKSLDSMRAELGSLLRLSQAKLFRRTAAVIMLALANKYFPDVSVTSKRSLGLMSALLDESGYDKAETLDACRKMLLEQEARWTES